MPVILADRNDTGCRVLFDPAERNFCQFFAHLVISPAKLAAGALSLAVKFAIPLRVVGEIFVRRQQIISCVAPAKYLIVISVGGRNIIEMPVQFELGGEQGMLDRVAIERLSI